MLIPQPARGRNFLTRRNTRLINPMDDHILWSSIRTHIIVIVMIFVHKLLSSSSSSVACPVKMYSIYCKSSSQQSEVLQWLCVIAIYSIIYYFFVRVEKVPFLERYYLVLPRPIKGTTSKPSVINSSCRYISKNYGKILPPTHPASIRAASMLRNIVQATHNVLRLEKDSTVRAYTWDCQVHGHGHGHGCCDQVWTVGRSTSTAHYHAGTGFSTKHLEGRDWKVVVTDTDIGSARVLFNSGLIFICRGWLDSVDDAELAFAMGHEVGHVIGQNRLDILFVIKYAAYLTLLSPCVLMMYSCLVLQYVPPFKMIQHKLQNLTENNPTRRLEYEADHTGMMLMASAGYDPREPAEKWRRRETDATRKEYKLWSTHPWPQNRVKSLEKPERLSKAMDLYREFNASQGVSRIH